MCAIFKENFNQNYIQNCTWCHVNIDIWGIFMFYTRGGFGALRSQNRIKADFFFENRVSSHFLSIMIYNLSI